MYCTFYKTDPKNRNINLGKNVNKAPENVNKQRFFDKKLENPNQSHKIPKSKCSPRFQDLYFVVVQQFNNVEMYQLPPLIM